MLHAVPEAGGSRGGNGDPALLFLRHPVHGSGAVVDFAQLVTDPGVKQNPLGRRGFAGINVRRDADIAVAFDGGSACHNQPFLALWRTALTVYVK